VPRKQGIAVNLHVLVFVYDDHSFDVSLHQSGPEALQAAAEQAMHLMLAESLVDIHGVLGRMNEAFNEADYDQVIRHFEKARRRKVAFIRELPVPATCG
jgi:hypothetical protein